MKPILFNTKMVRTILDNRKTVTRRVVKPQPVRVIQGADNPIHAVLVNAPEEFPKGIRYRPGDILYVRETRTIKEAARIFLRVTDVRVERLQEITEEQAKAEGAALPLSAITNLAYRKYIGGYRGAFKKLWDSTIKSADLALYGWDANLWVWVIEFERISREEAEVST